MAVRMIDPSGVHTKRRANDYQDFMAVILVGYGENLYPFNEGTNVVSKALLPVGNVPIISHVLDWVLDGGIMDILLIVPPVFHSSISNYLAENYTNATHPRARIDLKRHTDGEKEEDEIKSEGSGRVALDNAVGITTEREGTARLLKRFRHHIKNDFVLLPCDLSPPSYLTLASVLDKHRASPSAVLTAVLYEPAEPISESEEKLFVAIDRESDEVLLIQPLEAIEDELETRMALIDSHPLLSLSARLLDAHIYVCRRTVLDLLATRRPKDLDSMKEQVIPWLVKGGWQRGLGERWAPILAPARRDPFADALSRSTTASISTFGSKHADFSTSSPSSDQTPLPRTGNASPITDGMEMSFDDISKERTSSTKLGPGACWRCQVIVAAPAAPAEPVVAVKGGKADKNKPKPEADYLIRANSLAGYWEMNRRFLRTLAANAPTTPRPQPAAEESGSSALISPTAQISPDSLLGEGTRVGDRASIKKCIIGRHCVIGRGAKLTGCVLWDFVTVEENARIENTILCSNVRVGEKAQVKDCEFGTGFEAKPGAILKGERLVVGQEA